jgi:hypothetical protein
VLIANGSGALLLETAREYFTLRKQRHAGHRIRISRWPPDLALRITGDAALFLHVVVVRLQVVIGDWPVCALVIQRPRSKVFFMQARPDCVVMHRAATDTVPSIEDVADGIFPHFDDRRAAPFQSSRPDPRTDEFIVAAFGAGFEDHDFLATRGEPGRDRTTGSTGTDYDGIDFFVRHRHSPHLLGGSMCAM